MGSWSSGLTDAGEEHSSLVDGLPSLCVEADGDLQTPNPTLGQDVLLPWRSHSRDSLLTLLSLTSELARLMLNLSTVPSSSGHRAPAPHTASGSARPRSSTSTLTPSVCFTPKATAPAGAALPETPGIFRGLQGRRGVPIGIHSAARNAAKTGHAGVSTLTFQPCSCLGAGISLGSGLVCPVSVCSPGCG